MTTYRSWRRSTSGRIGPHRLPGTGSADTLSHTQHATNLNHNKHRAIWRSGTPIHRHNMHCTKANTPYQIPTTGHCHLQLAWFHKIRRIHEKDPQTLKDSITKVKKLNAAKQLTATNLPPSMVNMMSNDDQCFQCQEPGHTAWCCPHIRCHECKEYRHITMDCPKKYCLRAHQHSITRYTKATTPGQALDTAEKI